jgi:4-aminobutyrate aminotransferase
MDDSFNRTEGDVNVSPSRKAWSAQINDDRTTSLLAEDARYFLHQALSTPCLDVLESCEGVYLTDVSGRRYMDFHGNNVHQLGHRNRFIIDRIKEQMDILPFSPRRFTNAPAIEFARKLASLLPGNLNRVLFAPGGTSSISMALKLARIVTGKHKVISLWDSFHGASLDAIAAGGERGFREGMGPLIPGVERIPPPTTYRGPFTSISGDDIVYAEYLEYVIEKEGNVGAFIVETVRNTDVQIPSKKYWKKVREICTRHGVLLILDEIPIAFGRTGKMFAFELYDIEPDILCLGKGLGGGIMPMAGIVARDIHNVALDVSLGHFTHEKSPLGCVAGIAMLEYMEKHNILKKVQDDSVFIKERLDQLMNTYPLIGDVRGVGLLWGVELVKDRVSKEKAIKEAEIVMYDCLKNGLSFKVSQGNVLQLSPPLTITREQLTEALRILEHAIVKAASH